MVDAHRAEPFDPPVGLKHRLRRSPDIGDVDRVRRVDRTSMHLPQRAVLRQAEHPLSLAERTALLQLQVINLGDLLAGNVEDGDQHGAWGALAIACARPAGRPR